MVEGMAADGGNSTAASHVWQPGHSAITPSVSRGIGARKQTRKRLHSKETLFRKQDLQLQDKNNFKEGWVGPEMATRGVTRRASWKILHCKFPLRLKRGIILSIDVPL